MQAVILVGGEGTRLRPLTSLHPKPVITLVDRPFMVFMLEWLRGHGVTDVIMSCGFLPTKIEEALGDGSQLGMSIRYLVEPEPRGTAGALKFAEEHLDDRFLMLNGDVLTDVDISAQIAQHEATGAVGTLGLVGVADPSAYGLVLQHDDGAVSGFLEKPGPEELEGVEAYNISAGIYVLERSVLDMIEPDRNVSIEREIWPALVGNGLYAKVADAYWIDIGTPERYLEGTFDILAGRVKTRVLEGIGPDGLGLAADADIRGEVIAPAIVGAGATVEAGASVGPDVVLGPGVTVAAQSTVRRSVVLAGSVIGPGCELEDCIVAPGAKIGDGTVIRDGAVLGENVVIGAGNVLSRGMKVFPGATLGDGAVKF